MIPLGPCRTRCGAPATVIRNDIRDPEYPVVAVVDVSPTEQRTYVYTAEGAFDSRPYPPGTVHPYDLIPEPRDAAGCAGA